MNNKKERKIKFLRKEGYSYREILKRVNVSKRLISKIAKETKFSRKGRKRYYSKVTGIVKPIKKQKDKLTLAKTRIIGNLLFDGSLYKTIAYHHSIMYVNSSFKLVKRFCEDLDRVYGVQSSLFIEKGKIIKKIYRAKYNSKLIRNDLLNYTKSYSTSNKLAQIPLIIMNSSRKYKIELLRTFWDNEGSVSSRDRVLQGSSNSFKVIKQLAKIHKEFGFEYSIYKNIGSYKPHYIFRLRKNHDNIRRFYKLKLFTDSIVAKGYLIGMKKIDVLKTHFI